MWVQSVESAKGGCVNEFKHIKKELRIFIWNVFCNCFYHIGKNTETVYGWSWLVYYQLYPAAGIWYD